MHNDELYDVVIVGGGPAGMTAAIFAVRAAAKALLVEKALPGGQMALTKEIDNYPGFREIMGHELSDKFLEHAEGFGIELAQKEVTSVSAGNLMHQVHFDDKSSVRAHSVIIATGGEARRLNVPGELENLGSGVSYCATCDGFFFRNRNVVVVGGGETALQEAMYLSKIAGHVSIIHRRNSFKANAVLQKHIASEPNISIIYNTVIERIISDDDGVREVAVRNLVDGNDSILEAEGVFIFVGFSPLNHLIPPGIRKTTLGYVVTDEKCETGIPGIFVAGDLRHKYANQIVIAASDGCISGMAAARHAELKKVGCREIFTPGLSDASITMVC